MRHILCSNGSWIDEAELMTVISAYVGQAYGVTDQQGEMSGPWITGPVNFSFSYSLHWQSHVQKKPDIQSCYAGSCVYTLSEML